MADPAFAQEPITVIIEDDDDTTRVDPRTGALEVKTPEGGVVVHLDAHANRQQDGDEDEHFANLALDMDPAKLSTIANELLEQIDADDQSRSGYLANLARGMDELGLKLEDPKGDISTSSAPLEGMATVRNPLLLEACLRGWANSQAELLPAEGPVKIKDDGDESPADADQAAALCRDMNYYLTKVATEYYPDTSHMLLWGPHFGGSGFKKVYRCPMRRRPVSESVAAKDLIVSDATKDLASCSRITHVIPMRPSVFKRMRLVGAYRDIGDPLPSPEAQGAVDQKIDAIQGTRSNVARRPEDQDYTIYETQCELDLPEYATGDLKGEGIPLPYLVTIDKTSREVLALRRDWKEDDDQCHRKRMYVRYPYVPGPGFYGTGLLQILGNANAALTAAWREALDAGMFASFPGWLIAKIAARQNTNELRVPPGGAVPLDVGERDIRTVAMPLPYHDVTPGLMSLIDKITQQAQRVGGTAEMPVGEGRQDAPVGTTLALIEQATKVVAAAHKGMHTAQAEEFGLIEDIFRDNPEDFWRDNPDCATQWDAQTFIAALDNCKLVPVADPNVPSQMHRIAKKLGLLQLAGNPLFQMLINPKELLIRCLRVLGEPIEGLIVDPPPMPAAQQPPVDPARMLAAQAAQTKAQAAAAKVQLDARDADRQAGLKEQELQTDLDLGKMNLARETLIHAGDQDAARREQMHDEVEAARAHGLAQQQHGLAVTQAAHDATMDQQTHALAVHQALNPPKPAPSSSGGGKK